MTAAKDREILSLRRQLDASNDELTEAGRGREIALRENRRIQEDMALMTRENQVSAVSPSFSLISCWKLLLSSATWVTCCPVVVAAN